MMYNFINFYYEKLSTFVVIYSNLWRERERERVGKVTSFVYKKSRRRGDPQRDPHIALLISLFAFRKKDENKTRKIPREGTRIHKYRDNYLARFEKRLFLPRGLTLRIVTLHI